MKSSFREKIRYRFENYMSKGGLSIFFSLFTLFIISFIVVFFLRILYFFEVIVIRTVFKNTRRMIDRIIDI